MSLPKGEKTVLCFNWVYIATRLETMINYGLNLGSLTTSSQLLGLTLILLFEQRDSNHQRWRSWNWLKLRRAFGWYLTNVISVWFSDMYCFFDSQWQLPRHREPPRTKNSLKITLVGLLEELSWREEWTKHWHCPPTHHHHQVVTFS